MEPHTIAEQLVAFFERDRRGVLAAWLFGSMARGDARPDSDVDVAVLFAESPARTYDAMPLGLQADLALALERETDLVNMNLAPPELRARVLREGRLLFDDEPSRRIAFEVRTRNEYFDMEPRLREYRRSTRVRNGR